MCMSLSIATSAVQGRGIIVREEGEPGKEATCIIHVYTRSMVHVWYIHCTINVVHSFDSFVGSVAVLYYNFLH